MYLFLTTEVILTTSDIYTLYLLLLFFSIRFSFPPPAFFVVDYTTSITSFFFFQLNSLLHCFRMSEQWLIFVLGTNNWQGPGQFAPGSGILHQGQHIALNSLPNAKCYSVWPSDILKTPTDEDDYRVYEIPHPIPICESVGPQSSKRWHSMSDEECDTYVGNLKQMCIEYIDYIEKKNNRFINLFFAHHCFMNPVILSEINEERVLAGKPKVPVVVFAHGTALKMYQNEINKLPDFPMKYYDWIRKEKKIFEGTDKISGVFAVSDPQKETFRSLFPDFPADHVAVTPCGYNQLVFYPKKDMTRSKAFGQMPQVLYEGFDHSKLPSEVTNVDQGKTVPDVDSYDHVVVFCGRFADWKRLDSVLSAASRWEKEGKKVLTLIFGAGSQEARVKYVDMAYQDLKLNHTFFLGPQGQPELADVYTVTDVSVFPSKDEPFGLVFIECMGCGTPVIGAKSGGPLDFVNEDVGTLVDEGTNEEVGDRVYTAVTKALSEDWKKTKGPACEKYALEKFSLKRQADQMLQYLESHFL
ncbi:sucrose-phosphate synthase-like protein [Angomonas deanei]|nr:sucrose-phosphate synthase-like protein [Angomonas deanei]|eukprot:EPY38879.1 sucrose-phosphate synthase-like protein [Angomonas deanei]